MYKGIVEEGISFNINIICSRITGMLKSTRTCFRINLKNMNRLDFLIKELRKTFLEYYDSKKLHMYFCFMQKSIEE